VETPGAASLATARAGPGKLLVLCWTIPPAQTGMAAVVGNLASQFSRDEMLIVGERPHHAPAAAWAHDRPELVYLVNGWPPTRRGARWWRKIQFLQLLVGCVRMARRHRCTSIMVVFPKVEYLLAGYLAAVVTGARLFPYFHNTYLENREGFGRQVARFVQACVFRRATHVFVMSAGMVELYRERYPGLKCSALVHSFPDRIPDFVPPPPPRSPLRIMICGNINESCREATIRAGAAIARVEDASLTFLSATPRTLLEQMGLLRRGVGHETPDQIQPRLREADIVVLPHGFEGEYSADEYRTIFPTKTIEYLLCGRPILAHAPPDSFLVRFLRKHGCALIVDEPSLPAVVQAIGRLRADANLRSALVRNALLAAEQFRATHVAVTLRRELQEAGAAASLPEFARGA
jgi:hypothetical protein